MQSHLLEQARVADPMLLARYATSLIDRLDQDGRYRELGHQQQRRELRIVSRPDGSCRLEGYCTVEAAEQLRVFVDAMAAPHPAVDGTPDPRSAATIVLTMDAQAYATGIGTAIAGHGDSIPADVAKKWAGDEARMIAVLLRDTQRIEAYSSTQRCFSEQQRLALTARDKGSTLSRL